jgi:hypothetical protein
VNHFWLSAVIVVRKDSMMQACVSASPAADRDACDAESNNSTLIDAFHYLPFA